MLTPTNGGVVHAWNGYHLSFGIFPCFIVFFASKLAIFPSKRSVLGAWKGHILARKGHMLNSGFQDHKTTWNAFKQGKTSQHHNWPRYMDCPQIGPKGAIKLGKKRQKDKWYLFRAPTCRGCCRKWYSNKRPHKREASNEMETKQWSVLEQKTF